MNSTSLVVRDIEPVSMDLFNLLREQAGELLKSGFLPPHLKTPEQVITVALIGRELGLPMMLALRKIYIIQGTPALAAELMLALAERTGELEDLRITDDGVTCTVTTKRKGRPSTISTSFGMADAKSMGLATRENWTKQAPVMRRWRAISANIRLNFSDATGGLYTLEELAPEVKVDAQGSPISPVSMAPSEDLMPRRKDEPPETQAPHAPPLAPEPILGDPRAIVEGPPDPGDSARLQTDIPVIRDPDPVVAVAPSSVGIDEPSPLAPGQLRITINGRDVITNGATKDQLMKAYKLGALVDELVGKGKAKEILGREAGCEHRHELTEAGARIYIAALSQAINAADKRR